MYHTDGYQNACPTNHGIKNVKYLHAEGICWPHLIEERQNTLDNDLSTVHSTSNRQNESNLGEHNIRTINKPTMNIQRYIISKKVNKINRNLKPRVYLISYLCGKTKLVKANVQSIKEHERECRLGNTQNNPRFQNR